MANFWAGFGQGFSGGFKRSWDAAARRRERGEDRKQALEDAEKRREVAREIADRVRQDKLTDLKMQLERDAIKERQGREAILESLSPEAREKALGDRLLFTGQQPETPAMLEGLDMGEVGRLDKYDTMTPSELQGTGLAGQRIEKELLAEKTADRSLEDAMALLKVKSDSSKKAELSTEDAVDGIIQMRAQLGPQGSRGPQPSREALLLMGRGPIMQLYGAYRDKIAVQKRERDIADSKKKGTGLSGSTRGYKAAAEAGVRYDELLKDVEKDLKEGKEPDPLKMREMKSNMAHVMAFYQYPGRLVPPHLEDLVRGAGRTPNNAILTDMANAHELSMYGESLAKDIKHLSEKYGKDKMTAFIGPIQKPLSELLTVFGIDDENEDRFIVNRLSQKYQDMANYKLFIESGKTVTEQEFKRLKTVVGDPTREDFLEKLLGFAQLQTERTQRKLKAYKDVGLRFNPDLEKAIYKGATPQGSGGLSSAEDTELQKLKAAKAANLMDDASKRRYLELLKKLAEEN